MIGFLSLSLYIYVCVSLSLSFSLLSFFVAALGPSLLAKKRGSLGKSFLGVYKETLQGNG